MKYPLVEVKWIDANSKQEEVTVHDLPNIAYVFTVGHLLKKNKTAVWVAQELLPPSAPGEGDSFRATTVVPRGMVRRIRRLK